MAADLDLTDKTKRPFWLADIAAATTVLLPANASCTISPIGLQPNESENAETDYLIVQCEADAADATLDAGRKVAIQARGDTKLRSLTIPGGTDGARELRLAPSGNGLKVQFIIEEHGG